MVKALSNNPGIWEGLHHLRKSSMVHLDLRPTNIFLDNNIVPKIADFCLSSCLEEKQNQAIASKQFGSMWSIESGMDSSSVVQVSSLVAHLVLH